MQGRERNGESVTCTPSTARCGNAALELDTQDTAPERVPRSYDVAKNLGGFGHGGHEQRNIPVADPALSATRPAGAIASCPSHCEESEFELKDVRRFAQKPKVSSSTAPPFYEQMIDAAASSSEEVEHNATGIQESCVAQRNSH